MVEKSGRLALAICGVVVKLELPAVGLRLSAGAGIRVAHLLVWVALERRRLLAGAEKRIGRWLALLANI